MSNFDKAQSLPIDQRAELSYQLAESLMDSLIEEDELNYYFVLEKKVFLANKTKFEKLF